LPRATRKHLGSVLVEKERKRARGVDWTLGFAGFQELAIPRDMEKNLRKNKKVMGGKI